LTESVLFAGKRAAETIEQSESIGQIYYFT